MSFMSEAHVSFSGGSCLESCVERWGLSALGRRKRGQIILLSQRIQNEGAHMKRGEKFFIFLLYLSQGIFSRGGCTT